VRADIARVGADRAPDGTLRGAWEDEARQWVRWAREPDVDHFFWRFSRPALLDLLPDPGRLTVDVGCGEGRLSRELRDRGHRVAGVEQSPTLAAAAREADPQIDVHVTDAAHMPLADGAADLCVASMVLLNLDDLDAVVREVARVLGPGGRFCFSTTHPFVGRPEWAEDYFEVVRFTEARERDGVRMTFHDVYRPLGSYLGALERAGFVVEALREPVPDDAYVAAHPTVERWRRAPCFLLVRARLSAATPGSAATPRP
jgi:SAM-dependent methyltransferase